jgi:hypothetical protein
MPKTWQEHPRLRDWWGWYQLLTQNMRSNRGQRSLSKLQINYLLDIFSKSWILLFWTIESFHAQWTNISPRGRFLFPVVWNLKLVSTNFFWNFTVLNQQEEKLIRVLNIQLNNSNCQPLTRILLKKKKKKRKQIGPQVIHYCSSFSFVQQTWTIGDYFY